MLSGAVLACTRGEPGRLAAGSDVVPDPTQWNGGTSPARSVLYQAFKPVALPERPFSHTRTRRLPLGGTRGTVAEGPSLYIWARVRSSGRARTRETTIPSAETGTSSRLALPTGNKVAKAIGFLPEEREKSAPPRSRMTHMTRLARQSWLPRIVRLPRPGKPDDHSIACQGAGKGAHSCCIRQGLFKGLFKDDLRGSPQG